MLDVFAFVRMVSAVIVHDLKQIMAKASHKRVQGRLIVALPHVLAVINSWYFAEFETHAGSPADWTRMQTKDTT